MIGKMMMKPKTGETLPIIENPEDKRRTFARKFSEGNQALIISDILKGSRKFAAEWMLVTQKIDDSARWILKPMNFCLNLFGNGKIEITKRGNFKISKIKMQRKGGDNGRKIAQNVAIQN